MYNNLGLLSSVSIRGRGPRTRDLVPTGGGVLRTTDLRGDAELYVIRTTPCGTIVLQARCYCESSSDPVCYERTVTVDTSLNIGRTSLWIMSPTD